MDEGRFYEDEKLSLIHATGFSGIRDEIPPVFQSDFYWQHSNTSNVYEGVLRFSGGNALLYALSLHFWQKAFGTSTFATRSLSLLIGCFSLVALFYCVERIYNLKTALITTLLIALHPTIIWIDSFTRAYSMVFLLSIMTTALVLQALKDQFKSNSWIILYVLAMPLLFFTHFVAITIGMLHLIIVAFYFRKPDRIFYQKLRVVLTFFVLMGAIIYYSGPVIDTDLINTRNQKFVEVAKDNVENRPLHSNWIEQPTPINLIKASSQLFVTLFAVRLQDVGLSLKFSVIYLLIIFGVYIYIYRENLLKNNKLLIPFSLLIVPLLIASALSIRAGHTMPFVVKYHLFFITLAMMIMAIILAQVFEKNKLHFAILIVVQLLVMHVLVFTEKQENVKKSIKNYDQLALALTEITNSSDTVVFSSRNDAMFTNLYLKNYRFHQTVDGELSEHEVYKLVNGNAQTLIRIDELHYDESSK